MISTVAGSTAMPALPRDVIHRNIFPHLALSALGVCSRVCKSWNKMAKEQMKAFSHPTAFGPKEW